MIIKYNKNNTICSIITIWQIIFNPILAIFNFALITVIDNTNNRVLKLNKIKYGQLFFKRFNIIGNYKMYIDILKNNKWI